MELYIPANNHEFRHAYGDYGETARKNERVNHMPKVIQFEGEAPIYNQ